MMMNELDWIIAAGERTDERDIEKIVNLMSFDDPEVRYFSLEAIQSYIHSRPELEQKILTMLDDDDELVRASAIEALQACGNESLSARVLSLVDDSDELVRVTSYKFFHSIKDETSTNLISKRLDKLVGLEHLAALGALYVANNGNNLQQILFYLTSENYLERLSTINFLFNYAKESDYQKISDVVTPLVCNEPSEPVKEAMMDLQSLINRD